MAKIDQFGADVIARLVLIVADEVNKHYTDDGLLNECVHVFDALDRAISYMNIHGITQPPVAEALIYRFVDAADGTDWLEQFFAE